MEDLLRNIKTKKVTKNLIHETATSLNESHVYLNVKYLDKFFINKTFVNNNLGREQLEEAKKLFDTEEKIKEYLGV